MMQCVRDKRKENRVDNDNDERHVSSHKVSSAISIDLE